MSITNSSSLQDEITVLYDDLLDPFGVCSVCRTNDGAFFAGRATFTSATSTASSDLREKTCFQPGGDRPRRSSVASGRVFKPTGSCRLSL